MYSELISRGSRIQESCKNELTGSRHLDNQQSLHSTLPSSSHRSRISTNLNYNSDDFSNTSSLYPSGIKNSAFSHSPSEYYSRKDVSISDRYDFQQSIPSATSYFNLQDSYNTCSSLQQPRTLACYGTLERKSASNLKQKSLPYGRTVGDFLAGNHQESAV